MVHICAAPGCRIGLRKNGVFETSPGISMHRFPLDPLIFAKWVQVLSHPDWSPKTQSRVCSLHFRESDYIYASQDRQVRRKRRNFLQGRNGLERKLMRRRLRSEAVPSIFGDAVHACKEESRVDEPNVDALRQEDFECSFDHLLEFLDDATWPEQVSVIRKPHAIVFMGTEDTPNGRCRVIYQLSVFQDCSFKMEVQNTVCNQSIVSGVTHGRCIRYPSEITDILTILKEKAENYFSLKSNVELMVREFQRNLSQFVVEDEAMQSKIQAMQYQIFTIMPRQPRPAAQSSSISGRAGPYEAEGDLRLI
ncbi:hypothetical protein TCAL_02440 [Tigriopus californicus]|uniref:THAP-type domain-containing protein n=1 Tax=Tigriopus californicus TaxID=6832 RepID=A0A553NZW0_TIGCA|nr:uncharacterized protein LOC131886268 [Tigriopus californicus]TRY70973.1 hypothetical protein TCAL_02440 [Tigriopus californicus]|eukprot:TCALIF_02440-PA protein Name:"Protein of unknown function" AED:0.00 eAED:0.00 QI:118/1/1/1/1/1/2/134/306